MMKNSKKMYQIEATLRIHPKNYLKSFYIDDYGKELIESKKISFKDLAEYLYNTKRHLMVKLTRVVQSGKHEGEKVSGQDIRSDTKISDFLNSAFGVDTTDIYSVCDYVKDCLISLGVDKTSVFDDYLDYINNSVDWI